MKRTYNCYEHWLAKAQEAGYDSPDEAIVALYRQHRSLHKVAVIMGVSVNGVRTHLKRLGEPIQPRGGANNPIGRALKHRVMLTYHGETRSLADWARKTGLNYATLWSRVKLGGWKTERALSTPVQTHETGRFKQG
jgi:hypothetical protein